MPKVTVNKNFEMNQQFEKVVKHCFVDTKTNCETLSKATSTCLSTVYGKIRKPDGLTLAELRIWAKVLRMTDEQLLSFIRGVK